MLTYERIATAVGICLGLGSGVIAWVYVSSVWSLAMVPALAAATFLRLYGRRLDERATYVEVQ
jgi:uncharacterized membrane protein